jgi:hypothetical protein
MFCTFICFRLVELIILDSLKSQYAMFCFVAFRFLFSFPKPQQKRSGVSKTVHPRQEFHWAADIFCHHPVSQDDALAGVKENRKYPVW